MALETLIELSEPLVPFAVLIVSIWGVLRQPRTAPHNRAWRRFRMSLFAASYAALILLFGLAQVPDNPLFCTFIAFLATAFLTHGLRRDSDNFAGHRRNFIHHLRGEE